MVDESFDAASKTEPIDLGLLQARSLHLLEEGIVDVKRVRLQVSDRKIDKTVLESIAHQHVAQYVCSYESHHHILHDRDITFFQQNLPTVQPLHEYFERPLACILQLDFPGGTIPALFESRLKIWRSGFEQ